MLTIKRKGSIIIPQDRTTSEFFKMPKAASETQRVNFILPLEKIAPALVNLV